MSQQGASNPRFQGVSGGDFSIQEDVSLSQILLISYAINSYKQIMNKW